LIVLIALFAFKAYGQHQLYFENFQAATNTFVINDTAKALGDNKGNNKWIVNSIYKGGGIYPNTMSEDSTYSGSISFAGGKYLHIYDSASTYLNDNYNPTDSSTRFAHMKHGICTKSLTNINFNFWYLCQGSATAYGEVYYSIDGGPWTQTGSPLYNNKYKWQYATITNPVFTNVEDLRFGFLWHNAKAAGKDTSALGIDDVSLYGIYDSIAHPITCTFTTYGTDSCLGGSEYVFFAANLSDSTCSSVWDVYMSKGNGTFPGSYAWYQTISDTTYNDLTSYWYLIPPVSFTTVGTCYKFKMVRTSYPFLTFTDSVCFPFDSCPGTIITLQPPATLDTNAVCAGSVIDIPFLSTGIYSTYNVYYAELIDSIGATAKIDTIGNLPSNVSWPYPPGDVVSTIPLNTPPGCHYYVRVVSSTSNRKPFMWGPFCIQHCDILTDTMTSVSACLKSCKKQPNGDTYKIKFNVHEYDSLAKYGKGNKFEVQLIAFNLYPASFGAINTGLLGAIFDTTTGYMTLHIPCPDTLFANGINPGVYYIRVIADSSSFSDSAFGSLVQLTIGEPADSMYLTVAPPKGPYCTGATITFNANPNDGGPPYNSTYEWWSTSGKVTTDYGPGGAAYLGLNINTADTFYVSCQETNYGCAGSKAKLSDTIIVLGPPSISKTGPLQLCIKSDTGTYSIPFANNTNYLWRIYSKYAKSDTSNNVLKIVFDTTGTFKVSVVAFNACFTDSAVWSIKVIAQPVPVIAASPSTSICDGKSVVLTVSGGTKYVWSTGNTATSITEAPPRDTIYWVTVKNAACSVNDTVKITVIPAPTVLVTPTIGLVCLHDSIRLIASGAQHYAWIPVNGLNIDTGSIVYASPGGNTTYMVTGTNASGCADSAYSAITVEIPSTNVTSAVSITSGNSVTLTASGGGTYLWNTGATTDSITVSPTTNTVYTVMVTDPNNCKAVDTVTVEVSPKCGAIFVPDAFSPNNDGFNDKLYVRNNCIKDLDFIIYDRWGNKIFETTNPNEGWDGTENGKPMNTGTYAYYVNVLTIDNQILTKKGNVALIR